MASMSRRIDAAFRQFSAISAQHKTAFDSILRDSNYRSVLHFRNHLASLALGRSFCIAIIAAIHTYSISKMTFEKVKNPISINENEASTSNSKYGEHESIITSFNPNEIEIEAYFEMLERFDLAIRTKLLNLVHSSSAGVGLRKALSNFVSKCTDSVRLVAVTKKTIKSASVQWIDEIDSIYASLWMLQKGKISNGYG